MQVGGGCVLCMHITSASETSMQGVQWDSGVGVRLTLYRGPSAGTERDRLGVASKRALITKATQHHQFEA
jgi:hypothetical protein